MLLLTILLLASNFRQTSHLIRVHGEAQFSYRLHSLAILEEHRRVTTLLTVILGIDQVVALQVMAVLPITHQGGFQSPNFRQGNSPRTPHSNSGRGMSGSLGAVAAALDMVEVAAMIVAPRGMTHSTSAKLW